MTRKISRVGEKTGAVGPLGFEKLAVVAPSNRGVRKWGVQSVEAAGRRAAAMVGLGFR